MNFLQPFIQVASPNLTDSLAVTYHRCWHSEGTRSLAAKLPHVLLWWRCFIKCFVLYLCTCVPELTRLLLLLLTREMPPGGGGGGSGRPRDTSHPPREEEEPALCRAVAPLESFFAWPSSIPSWVCVPHFLIHLLIDGHLGCFYSLAITNTAAVNTRVQMSLRGSDFIVFGSYPEAGLLDPMIVPALMFCGTSIPCSAAAAPTYMPTNRQCSRGPLALPPPQHLLFVDLLMTAILTGGR